MRYFTISELTRSTTAERRGESNTPSPDHLRNLTELVEDLLDPIREAWAEHCGDGNPAIIVTSGYRGIRLNQMVGGSRTSAHCVGYAVDLVPANGRMLAFKNFLARFLLNRKFDQMISEQETDGVPKWVHVGIKDRQGRQRGQMLTFAGGKYAPLKLTR